MKRIIFILLLIFSIPSISYAQRIIVENTKREVVHEVVQPEPKQEKVKKKTKYQGEVTLGTAHLASDTLTMITINTVHGIRFTKRIFAGVGAGIQYAPGCASIVVPFYVNVKAYLPMNKYDLYVSLSPGYQIGKGFNNIYSGAGFKQPYGDFLTYKGFHLKTGVGINYKFLVADIGYMCHSSWDYADDYKSHILSTLYLNVGVKF